MKKKALYKIFLLISVSFFATCNAISFQNTSNDFKWKNKKFKNLRYLKLNYNPTIVNKIASLDPVFFNKNDTVNLDLTYKIENILKKKFKKRNIRFIDDNEIVLAIDTLVFQEYTESISVYSNEAVESLGVSEQDFFKFKIVGSIKRKNKTETVLAIKEHHTDPRESYMISGVIVKDGINANAKRMIENTINEFSYRTYESLNKNHWQQGN